MDERDYLPGSIRERLQDLMKEYKVTQSELAARTGSTDSALSRFISGKTDKISELGLSMQATREVNRLKVPVYQADLTTI